MKHFAFTLILITLSISCTVNKQTNSIETENKTLTTQSNIAEEDSPSETDKVEIASETPQEKEVSKYAGIAIDEKFGVIESDNDIYEKRIKGEKHFVDADKFKVEFDKFAPQRIKKNNKTVLNIKTRETEYAGFTVGVANLLSEDSKQIFLLGGTGGGVCCSVFWIFDTSNENVKTIFRSEDYDSYRDGMEIFDAEEDGIYELVLFDSSFRYMMSDCGSCSPEPRVVFKYNEKKKKYIPAKGIHQEFIIEGFKQSEKWIADSHEKLERNEKFESSSNYHRIVRAFVIDLIYFGDEKKAWEIFDKYYPKDYQKEENRVEIKKILRKSKFYQALKKS